MRQVYLLLVVLVMLTGRFVTAQTQVRAWFSAENGSPLVGEPVRLVLTVEVPTDVEVKLPEFPLDWPPFMVTSVGEVRKITDDDVVRTTYQRELIVILWQPGDYETPETIIEYSQTGSSEDIRIVVDPAFFSVPSVLNTNDLTLRPLKPPLALPYVSPLVVMGAAVVLVAGSAWGAHWYRRRVVDTVEVPLDATSRTLRELQRINALALPPFRTYPLVGDTLRQYVEAQFHISADEMTTEELLTALQAQPELDEQHRRELRRILDRVDLVKFAQFQPEADANKRLLQAAARWVEIASVREGEAK